MSVLPSVIVIGLTEPSGLMEGGPTMSPEQTRPGATEPIVSGIEPEPAESGALTVPRGSGVNDQLKSNVEP